ncbi:MAG: hypothetical protein EXQ70_10060 [Solirubrobacterales bacterium]|nr:hypothetical protein [Solirubrobacterales bacterium]
MSESDAGEGLRGRISSRGEEALGELAQVLLENPVFNQALQAAFGARERATSAGAHAMRNLNLPTAGEVERLERRLRSLSDRLEAVEDSLDGLARELVGLSKQLTLEGGVARGQASMPVSED